MSRLNLWACLKRQCVAGALLQKPVFTVQITLQNKQPLISLAEVRERPRRSRCFRVEVVEGGTEGRHKCVFVCLHVCSGDRRDYDVTGWLKQRAWRRRAGRRDCGWNSWWCSVVGEKVGGGGGCGTDGTGLMSKACFCFLFFLFWSELLSCFVLVHLHSGLSGGWTEWRSFCEGGKSKQFRCKRNKWTNISCCPTYCICFYIKAIFGFTRRTNITWLILPKTQ